MLELQHIVKRYGDNTVLDDISLSIEKGQIVSILGPSGGGKTTLLNVLLGITEVTDGHILMDGEDITRTPMEKRGFNIVFQDYALFPNLNAYENITYGLRNNPGIYTTIMVTHDPEEALTMSDMVLILNGGKIAQYSTPDQIVNAPQSQFIKDFILCQLAIKRDNIFALFQNVSVAPVQPTQVAGGYCA